MCILSTCEFCQRSIWLQTRWVAASSAAREAFAAASAQLLVQLWRAEAGLERAAASPVSKPASGLPAQLAACVLEQASLQAPKDSLCHRFAQIAGSA